MPNLTDFLRQRFNSWQKDLEHVLEQDSLIDHQKPVSFFETTTDVSHLEETLSYVPTTSTADQLIHIFSRLAPYFESGILLYKQNVNAVGPREQWSPGAVFYKGQYHPLEPQHLKLVIDLPRFNFFELRKTSPFAILQQLSLDEINDSADASAFAFKADQDFLFLVFSELPEPWLRTHIENIFTILKDRLSNT